MQILLAVETHVRSAHGKKMGENEGTARSDKVNKVENLFAVKNSK